MKNESSDNIVTFIYIYPFEIVKYKKIEYTLTKYLIVWNLCLYFNWIYEEYQLGELWSHKLEYTKYHFINDAGPCHSGRLQKLW